MTEYAHDVVVPDDNSDLSKKKQVAEMFNRIAFRYDFLNRFLSGGIDMRWRRKAIAELQQLQAKQVLDVATGTGDFAILSYKILHPDKVTGIDISTGMLELGRKKVEQLHLSESISLLTGDSETINFSDNSFDAVTVAFGVRNFENLEKGLKEMLRVLKPGGKLVVLEFSKPSTLGIKSLHSLYMKIVAPGLGKMIAKNKEAYAYLNRSVQAFPERSAFTTILERTGFSKTYFKPLSLGICCIYCGSK